MCKILKNHLNMSTSQVSYRSKGEIVLMGIPNPLQMTHICNIISINTYYCLNELEEGDNKSMVEVATIFKKYLEATP